MAEAPPATLRLRIDNAALQDNWRTLDRLSGSATAGAAVKADAYGIGVDQAVPALLEAGAREFFVAHWSEVPGVARFVPCEQISVLHGVNSPAEAAYAKAVGAIPVIDSLRQARIWRDASGGTCHLMVDTGINRLGVSSHELADPLLRQLEVDTLMSHLACADEDSAMNEQQLAAFREAANTLPHRQLSFANSAGIALGEAYHFDQTRPGLALYGGVPRKELAGAIRKVAFPQAAVLQTRWIEPGESVGYNASFTAVERMRIAVVSLGYADGFLRQRGPGAGLLFDGVELPILGKVSMDMVVVHCGTATGLKEGDWLDIPFDLPEVSERSGLSQYELLTTLGHRFDRDRS